MADLRSAGGSPSSPLSERTPWRSTEPTSAVSSHQPLTPRRDLTAQNGSLSSKADGWRETSPASTLRGGSDAAQARLFRVIEEVSQELTRRISGHEAMLAELQRHCRAEETRHNDLRAEIGQSRSEDSAKYSAVATELSRLASASSQTDSMLAQHEAEMSNLRRLPAEVSLSEQHLNSQREQHEYAISAVRQEFRQELQRDNAKRDEKFAELQQQVRQEFQRESVQRHANLVELQQQIRQEILRESSQHSSRVAEAQQQLRQELQQSAAQRDARFSELQFQMQSQSQERLDRQQGKSVNEMADLHQLRQTLQLQLSAQLERHEAAIEAGHQQLRGDIQKRDADLAELKVAAERLTRTAVERIQGGGGLAAKLAQIEGEVRQLKHQTSTTSPSQCQDNTCDASLTSGFSAPDSRRQSTLESAFPDAPAEDLRQLADDLRGIVELRETSSDLCLRVTNIERELSEVSVIVKPGRVTAQDSLGQKELVRTLNADPTAAMPMGPRRTGSTTPRGTAVSPRAVVATAEKSDPPTFPSEPLAASGADLSLSSTISLVPQQGAPGSPVFYSFGAAHHPAAAGVQSHRHVLPVPATAPSFEGAVPVATTPRGCLRQ